jgi:excisionase family DNA binding protein
MDDETRTTLIKRTIERLRGVAGALERGEATRHEARRLAADVRVAVSNLVAVYGVRADEADEGRPTEEAEDAADDDEDDEDDDEDDDEKRPILITVREAAARLGLGRTTVQSLVLRGELASLLIGRARRIPVWVIDDYMATHPRAGDG